MIKRFKLICFIICLAVSVGFLLGSFAPTVQAANIVDDALGGAQKAGAGAGYSPGTSPDQLPAAIIKFLNGVLTVLGVIFLGLMLYAGWLWMNARGNEEEVAKAKKIFTEAIIGIIIILLSRLFAEFLFYQFGAAANTK